MVPVNLVADLLVLCGSSTLIVIATTHQFALPPAVNKCSHCPTSTPAFAVICFTVLRPSGWEKGEISKCFFFLICISLMVKNASSGLFFLS